MAITKDAFGQPKPTPSSPERVQSTDVANNIIQSTQAITDAWDPFIAKVKRFTDMVDKISEVCNQHNSSTDYSALCV
jgi:hypothetical protein